MKSGLLVIDKPSGISSRDVVNRICRAMNTKKVGHTGTLDPLATGCLVMAIGEALRVIEFINHDTKEYIATAKVGLLTDTLDVTGNILKEEKGELSKDKLLEVINSFKGKYLQEVPLYSSIKINGMRLYKYAREGKDIDLPKREVEIYDIELLDVTEDTFTFKCLVSKGTYIRSLIRDIGEKLRLPCVMESLRRTKEGMFTIEEAIKLDDINEETILLPINRIFSNYYEVVVDSFIEKKVINGRVLEDRYDKDEVLFKNQNDEILAIYQKAEPGKIKPYKVFKHN